MGRPLSIRLAAFRPQLRRMLGLAHLRELSAEGGALHVGVTVGRFLHLLSQLRGQSLASTITIYRPEQLGRPLHVRTFVRLTTLEPSGRARFEQDCREDPWIAWASAVTGEYDYLLIGHHRDVRARNAWLRVLASRPGVGAVDSQILDIRFGHMLGGAVIMGANDDASDISGKRRKAAS